MSEPSDGCTSDDQAVIWCDLNAEQDAIEHALKKAGISYSPTPGPLDGQEPLIGET